MRLDKFICKSTHYTLAEALMLIETGRVIVNETVVFEVSYQAHKNSVVTLDGHSLTPRPFRYFMLHKPVDMICSNVDEKYPSVLNLLDVDSVSELHIAGRLDADTTGLVLVTDDGHWSFNLTSPSNKCEKVYKVLLSKPISPDAAQRFAEGILLQGESNLTLPATLQIIDPYNVFLTLTEGRFHQVKRMFSAIGNRVKSLHRQQIGSLELDIEEGHWRSLTLAEVETLSVEHLS
ncbi:pseudouridine synthase [uncultured Amphritea sp.]|uniref:pseudouridine synthase n=1 Tax=uncultured Amphritea sp. TaxID=981605 RepID=UPI0026104BB6|nr:pseudouridine synthase [uncultured Amphritea sp.]